MATIFPRIHGIVKSARLPERMTANAACFDVYCCLYKDEIKANGTSIIKVADHGGGRQITMFPRDRVLMPTGLIVLVPDGFKLAIYPRSGLAFKEGITVVNSPGTVDADYSHELFILLINASDVPVVIKDQERIAQIEFIPVVTDKVAFERCSMEDVLAFRETQERRGGIGHTGK